MYVTYFNPNSARRAYSKSKQKHTYENLQFSNSNDSGEITYDGDLTRFDASGRIRHMPVADQQRMQEQERRPTSEKRDERRVGNVERRRPREKRSQSIPANSLESNTDRSVEKDSSEDTNAFVQNTLSDG